MLVEANIRSKTFGSLELYKDLQVTLNAGEKVGLIGRNGAGKTTLLDIIASQDGDYDGEVYVKKGIRLVSSRQEHHDHSDIDVLPYILGDLPEYAKLKHILDVYPMTMGENPKQMHDYSDALERFTTLGYFEIESSIERIMSVYQLPEDLLSRKINTLSGGQLRLVELIKVQAAHAHVILIDEPTNHMDYIAKADFINWMDGSDAAMLIITHDRDVLSHVDRIIEVRDQTAHTFSGNYEKYLKTNTDRMSGAVNEYEITQSRITNLEADIIRFRRLKEKSRTPGTIKRFKGLEAKAVKELSGLNEAEKPSFWIDQDSTANLSTKLKEAYGEHKSKTITLRLTKKKESVRRLLKVSDLSLGYGTPLFEPVSFELFSGARVQLQGRNGAGKTTIVSTLIATLTDEKLPSTVYQGEIENTNKLPIGVYSQNFEERYLEMSLYDAIEHTYESRDIPITDQKIRSLLRDFLFEPNADGNKPMSVLSGGQKARFQLISMLANQPQVIFLDEPTNHLDLPSIEELETALNQYHGAIVYISHDSKFTDAVGGDIVSIKAL